METVTVKIAMKNILVIEDDDFAYRSIELQLKTTGYTSDQILRQVQLCDIDRINADDIEIVLTDLSLLGYDCHTAFKKVKKKFPFTPIIVLCDISETEAAVKTIQHGAQDYLIKGDFDQKTLQKAMTCAIERTKILDKVLIEKQNLRAMINNTEDIIWSVDRNQKVILANNAYWERVKKISGKGKDEISVADFDKHLLKVWTGFYDQALRGELSKLIWSETDNGNKIYEEVRFNHIHDKHNNTTGVSCYSRDITKQYTHLKLIKKQNDQLRQIAWIQSHEVRGPVATILGLVHLFNLEDPGDPENKGILEKLTIAANQLDDIIKRINGHTIVGDKTTDMI